MRRSAPRRRRARLWAGLYLALFSSGEAGRDGGNDGDDDGANGSDDGPARTVDRPAEPPDPGARE